MNCVVYARVSTDKQAEKDLSIPAQLQAMRDYAHQRQWLIAEEFVEALADGTPFPQPSELKKQIDELETWVKNIRKRRQ